ncbi:MAG: hypothetical protein ACR2KQ_01650 [Actinomycetota bacterium]
MSQEPRRSLAPFLFSLGVSIAVAIVVALLPETVVDQLRRNRALDEAQAGWSYRLLAFMAIAQALYVGLAMLRGDNIGEVRSKDPKLARVSRSELVEIVHRNAAGLPLLTLVYGLTAFVLTGERAGFWLFLAIVLVQLAWYFKKSGEVAASLGFQPEFAAHREDFVTPSARPDPHGISSGEPEEPG